MDASDFTSVLNDFNLDILGQRPRINRIYTQITLCFPLPNESSDLQPELINALTRGVERLSANFPSVEGKVLIEDGSFKIKSYKKTPRLVTKDLRHDRSLPDWNSLRWANFPFSMLDESFIAPCKTLANSDELPAGLAVFLIQANFII